MDAQSFASAVEGHWAIENRLHWVLDIAFREDKSGNRKQPVKEEYKANAIGLPWIKNTAKKSSSRHFNAIAVSAGQGAVCLNNS